MGTGPFFACILAITAAIGSAGTALARCPKDNPRPIVSLVEGLEVKSPVGDVLARLGYLQVAATDSDVAFGDDAQVTVGAATGIVEAGMFLSFAGLDCEQPRVLMSDAPQQERDLSNPLQAKALAGVTEARVARADGGGEADSIVLRKGPSFDAEKIDPPISLYTILYVHNLYRVNEVVDGRRAQETWYYVGATSKVQFAAGEDGRLRDRVASQLLGWVHADDLVFWSQRQAVFLASSASDQYVYDDIDLKERKLHINYVDDAAKDRAVPILKMPLLDAESGRSDVFRVAVPTQRGVLQAAGQGPATADASGQMAQSVLDDDTRVLFARMRENAANIDVLVVMDNSESMDVYRDAVIQGIGDLTDVVQRFDDLSVGFAMFGDFFNDAADADAWAADPMRGGFDRAWVEQMPEGMPFQFWLSDFAWGGKLPSVEELRETFGGYYEDPQRDRVEMGLPALRIAVETAGWRPESIKVVIYIGDDFSRVPAGDAQVLRTIKDSRRGDWNLEAPKSDGLLVRALKENRVLLLPINVAGAEVNEENGYWVEQVESLRAALGAAAGAGAFQSRLAYGEGTEQDIEATRHRVRDIIATLFAATEALREMQPSANIGETIEKTRARAQGYGVAEAQIVDEFFQISTATDQDGLRALAERSDMIQLGYYPKRDAEVFVALTFEEHNVLTSAIRAACIGMGSTASIRKTLEDMAETLAGSFLGEARGGEESGQEESIPEFFARITYLPGSYFSIFGDRSIDEFEQWVMEVDEAEYRKVQQELCFSRTLFEAVSDGRYARRDSFEAAGFDESRGIHVFKPKGELKLFDWLWGNESGVSLIFVPQEFFPSGS